MNNEYNVTKYDFQKCCSVFIVLFFDFILLLIYLFVCVLVYVCVRAHTLFDASGLWLLLLLSCYYYCSIVDKQVLIIIIIDLYILI